MVSRDADTRNNAWKKVGMKSANYLVAKKAWDRSPWGKIPVVSGMIEDKLDDTLHIVHTFTQYIRTINRIQLNQSFENYFK